MAIASPTNTLKPAQMREPEGDFQVFATPSGWLSHFLVDYRSEKVKREDPAYSPAKRRQSSTPGTRNDLRDRRDWLFDVTAMFQSPLPGSPDHAEVRTH